MRPLLSASLKMIIRDRQSLFWAMAFPILFLGAFRLFAFDSVGETELVVSADTSSGPAVALVAALQDVEFLTVEEVPGLDEAGALDLLEDGDANAGAPHATSVPWRSRGCTAAAFDRRPDRLVDDRGRH